MPKQSKALNEQDAENLRKGVDFITFCEKVLGINLNRAQKRVARRIQVGNDRQWTFKTGHIVAANQIGKTLLMACFILWACTYKVGVDPRDDEAWLNAPYLWLHLGPVQQQAYHVLKDIRRIIKNEHDAQMDAGGNTRGRFPTQLVELSKVATYYDGLVFWNGAEVQFRTGENKAEAILGYRAAGITIDESAFLDHLRVIVDEVAYMRLIASGGPLVMVSTPNGMNDFFDLVDAVRAHGKQPEDMVWVKNDQWLVWAFIDDNIGFGLTEQAVAQMEETINPATKEQQLRGAFLEPAEAFFVPQAKILDAFKDWMDEEEAPIPGHQYAEFWDPSVSSDPTSCIVLDVTTLPWRGVYMRWYPKPPDVTTLVGDMHKVHRYYHDFRDGNPVSAPTRAVCGFDATSMGGAIVKQLLSKISPKQPVNFGGDATKVPALINLRNLLTQGDIILPSRGVWLRLRQELANYKLKDNKGDWDNVMALMGASIVAGSMTGNRTSKKVDVQARVTRKKRLRWRT